MTNHVLLPIQETWRSRGKVSDFYAGGRGSILGPGKDLSSSYTPSTFYTLLPRKCGYASFKLKPPYTRIGFHIGLSQDAILVSDLNADVTEVKEGFGNQIHQCQDQGLNPGPPAQKSDTLSLDHQVMPDCYQDVITPHLLTSLWEIEIGSQSGALRYDDNLEKNDPSKANISLPKYESSENL
uniref:(California timema) hypothetical protein n=1 Tax=Timema californicum TaxID=61474 RepID=A0A7R9JDE8_TIMCA|nr:unnamed protein product [Timema californicum]